MRSKKLSISASLHGADSFFDFESVLLAARPRLLVSFSEQFLPLEFSEALPSRHDSLDEERDQELAEDAGDQ